MAHVRTNHFLLSALTLAISSAAVVGAELQPRTTRSASEPFYQLLERLDSTDVNEREKSEQRLADDAEASLDTLLIAAADKGLSPEQQLRVTRLAFQRFASTPRAALGISFQPAFVGGAESGAVIAGTIPGFDSQRALKPGDTIYALDDVRIQSMEDGKRVIQARDPGDQVALRIFRDGQPLIVHLSLGSMTDLERNSPMGRPQGAEPAVVRDAFRLRLQRAMKESNSDEPRLLDLSRFWVGTKVPASSDSDPAIQQSNPKRPSTSAESDEAPTSLTAGGRQTSVSEAQFDRFTANPGDLQAKLSGIARQMSMIDNQIQRVTQQVRDPNIGAERRARANNDLRILLEKRARLKDDMESLKPGGQFLRP